MSTDPTSAGRTGGTPAGTGPTLGTVIVSYNTRALLDRCLQTLRAEVEAAGWTSVTWVVDNASSDGSAALVAERHAWVRLEALETNVGFAAANNRVLDRLAADATARPDWVLLLNPDTEVRPGALRRLVDALAARPAAGVAGPRLVYPDGRHQHSAFRFPGLVQTALDLFPVARLTDHPLNGRYPRAAYEAGRPFDVDFPLGACMLLRGRALAEVGPLDARFFMYCEEIDWCWRARRAGWSALCVPEAVVVHHGGASTRQFRAPMFVALWRSRLRLFAKHAGPVRRTLLRALVRLGLGWRALVDRVAEARGRLSPDERRARRTAYRSVFSS